VCLLARSRPSSSLAYDDSWAQGEIDGGLVPSARALRGPGSGGHALSVQVRPSSCERKSVSSSPTAHLQPGRRWSHSPLWTKQPLHPRSFERSLGLPV
jgi:hypothetical protein